MGNFVKFLCRLMANRKMASRLANVPNHKYTDEEWAGFMNSPTI